MILKPHAVPSVFVFKQCGGNSQPVSSKTKSGKKFEEDGITNDGPDIVLTPDCQDEVIVETDEAIAATVASETTSPICYTGSFISEASQCNLVQKDQNILGISKHQTRC